MIPVNTRAARSLKTSSAYALLLCVGGWIFFLSPPKTCTSKFWFFSEALDVFPSPKAAASQLGLFSVASVSRELLGYRRALGCQHSQLTKCAGEIQGIHTARNSHSQDTACGCCLFARVPDLAPQGQESVCRAGSDTETSPLDLCCLQSTM